VAGIASQPAVLQHQADHSDESGHDRNQQRDDYLDHDPTPLVDAATVPRGWGLEKWAPRRAVTWIGSEGDDHLAADVPSSLEGDRIADLLDRVPRRDRDSELSFCDQIRDPLEGSGSGIAPTGGLHRELRVARGDRGETLGGRR